MRSYLRLSPVAVAFIAGGIIVWISVRVFGTNFGRSERGEFAVVQLLCSGIGMCLFLFLLCSNFPKAEQRVELNYLRWIAWVIGVFVLLALFVDTLPS